MKGTSAAARMQSLASSTRRKASFWWQWAATSVCPGAFKVDDPLIGRSFRCQASEAEGKRRRPSAAALPSCTDVSHLSPLPRDGSCPTFACRSLAHNTTSFSPISTPEPAMARDRFARQSLGGTLHQRIREVARTTRKHAMCQSLITCRHAS
jgi:hypothetical protein